MEDCWCITGGLVVYFLGPMGVLDPKSHNQAHQEDAFFTLVYNPSDQEPASKKIHWKSVLTSGFGVQAYFNGGC